MADRPPIRKVPSYRPPGLLRRPPARQSMHRAVSDTCPEVEPRDEPSEGPEITQSTNVSRRPVMARGEADGPEGPITQAGPRKARGGAPARPHQDPELVRLLGTRLQAALKARGVTQGQAAEALGVARSAVVQWCQGRTLPTLSRLHRAVITLGLDPRVIFPEWFV